MTVPGVNVIVAATFMAAVGDIRRFGDRRKLTAYLGLDPQGPPVRRRARQPRPHLKARLQQRPARARRGVLVDRPPARPDRRLLRSASKPRRGHSIAIVASARKLACLFWCLLTRGEDYAFAQPSLTTKKMRRLELAAGAPRRQGGRDVWSTNNAMRDAERELAAPSPARLRTHRRRLASQRPSGRERDTGARITRPSKGQSRAADHKPLTSALRYVSHSRPPPIIAPGAARPDRLDFHPSRKAIARLTEFRTIAGRPIAAVGRDDLRLIREEGSSLRGMQRAEVLRARK